MTLPCLLCNLPNVPKGLVDWHGWLQATPALPPHGFNDASAGCQAGSTSRKHKGARLAEKRTAKTAQALQAFMSAVQSLNSHLTPGCILTFYFGASISRAKEALCISFTPTAQSPASLDPSAQQGHHGDSNGTMQPQHSCAPDLSGSPVDTSHLVGKWHTSMIRQLLALTSELPKPTFASSTSLFAVVTTRQPLQHTAFEPLLDEVNPRRLKVSAQVQVSAACSMQDGEHAKASGKTYVCTVPLKGLALGV